MKDDLIRDGLAQIRGLDLLRRSREALRGEFRGLFKFRIGDYRVIYTLTDGDVLVLRIRHRGKVYE